MTEGIMEMQKIINALTTFYHRFRLRVKGCELGGHSRFCGAVSIQIEGGGKLHIGENIIITGGQFINALGCRRGSCIRVGKEAKIFIGDNCGFSDVSLRARLKITIGDYVTIGANSILNDSNAHSLNYLERRKERRTRDKSLLPIKHSPIVIEDDVFIGSNCIINKGCTIGKRSIIAAGSVVVCDVPADQIWGGNPAKFIKSIKYENN